MLTHLEARGFRNLEPLSQPFSVGSHLILGGNGAGKTSFLEAIYLLATTHSFRTSRIADCCQHGGGGFHLSGEVDTDRRVRLEYDWRPEQRVRKVNGKRAGLVEHLTALPIVCWTANDADILVGSPSARRRFLDRGVLGIRPAGIAVLSRYRQALREKRQLLLRGSGELETWNQVLSASAAELIRLRSIYVGRLRSALDSILEGCGLGLGRIDLHYRCSPTSGLEGASAVETEMMEVSKRERALQQPLLGPHRDDLSIRWDGHELRRVASAGERKALGLVLLAAHGRVLSDGGREPIYLLDDADTELDRDRLGALWSVLRRARQLFCTSNRPQAWEKIEIDHPWRCVSGRLRPG